MITRGQTNAKYQKQNEVAMSRFKPIKYLLQNELESLEALLERHQTTRNAILIMTALKTGGRASEILSLSFKDLDPNAKTVRLTGLKGSNDREIPMRTPIFNRLYEYAKNQPDKIFPITYNRFCQIWHEFRPVQKKLHSLRHTFAIEIYKKTNDIKLVQRALGHTTMTHTMIYMDYVYSAREMRRIL